MKSRSTSHVEDEAICMAILLDMDLKKILDVPPSQRVEKMWSMYRQLPAAVLFLPGKKLSSKIYGWAPARCRDCGNVGIPMSVPAHVTSQGFSVTLPGFLVESPSIPTKALIACVLEGQTFYIRQNEKLDSPSWRGIDMSKIQNLAVILGQDPMPEVSQRRPLVACIGALVAITSLEGETYHVQYIRMVSIIGKGSRYDEHPNPPWSEQEQKEKAMVKNATYTKVEQAWCVGSSFGIGDSKVPIHDNAL
ncbi:hypothetical protein MMC28_001712 [Mycoblastus sanguinarius]|nr:hypothetical protein [Mycoblastus sanguinarius]